MAKGTCTLPTLPAWVLVTPGGYFYSRGIDRMEGAGVKLINTNGMAFIGPGSEWFWTALSGVVLAVTFLAIYRQLRLQRNQGAIEQIAAASRELGSDDLSAIDSRSSTALRDGTDAAHVPTGGAAGLSNFWEGIGTLVRPGHLDRRLLWDADGNTCQIWWAYLAPWCLQIRKDVGDPAIYENFEWLAQAMREMDVRAGSTRSFDDVTTPAWIERLIASAGEQLQVELALRTVITAVPDAVSVAPPASAAPAEG